MSDSSSKLSRRTVFAGVGVAGAAGAVAALTRGMLQDPTPDTTQAQVNKPKPKRGGGYTLSEHVKQYYATARL